MYSTMKIRNPYSVNTHVLIREVPYFDYVYINVHLEELPKNQEEMAKVWKDKHKP